METPRRPLQPLNSIKTPFTIPATPQLTRLGLGTGIEVMRVKRSSLAEGRSPWAIKRLNKQIGSGLKTKIEERLTYEAQILRQLDHPAIVGFRDLVDDQLGRKCLAMEDGETSLGDVLELRLEQEEGPYPFSLLKKMCLDISSALKYLHTEAMILHGDLKSFNILVKGEVFKLCDFGVAVPINKDGFVDIVKHPSAVYTGTDMWSAPEVFDEEQSLIGTKSEIFCFGLVIYECLTNSPPHTFGGHTISEHKDSVITIKDSIISVKDSDDEKEDESEDESELSIFKKAGTRPELPDELIPEEYNRMVGLFFNCTHAEPEKRPSASEIFKYVNAVE